MLWRLLRLRETRTNEQRIAELRRRGARIGNSCLIYSTRFSTEPYLIDIGDHVGIAGGVQFITHHGFAMIIRRKHPDAQIFGRIRVGSGTVIGIDAISDALKAVQDGRLVGTVFQDARGQGALAVDLAVDLAGGKTVKHDNYLPFQLVTTDNVTNFLK